jgi:hypothetical protein
MVEVKKKVAIYNVWFLFSSGGEDTITLEAENIDEVKNLIKQSGGKWLEIDDTTINLQHVAEFKVTEISDDEDEDEGFTA